MKMAIFMKLNTLNRKRFSSARRNFPGKKPVLKIFLQIKVLFLLANVLGLDRMQHANTAFVIITMQK